MKKRAVSSLLAILAVVSLVLPVLAAPADEITAEEASVESPEIEEVQSAILLDGESVETVVYEIRNGVCYVTVSSFVSMLDPEAMVEEEDGVVAVNAAAVTEVVEVDGIWDGVDGLADETGLTDEIDLAGETGLTDDAGLADEETLEDEDAVVSEPAYEAEYAAADVVFADLNLTAEAGASYFVANGRYLYAGEGLIELDGRVAAPVRQLAKVFNLTVGYDAESGQILLERQEGAEPYLADGEAVYDSETLLWLSRIIYAESGNQPLEGKIAVGNVVMNRVYDPRFPDTIYDVLFQANQFSPASSGSIYREPNEESVVAAMLVLDGAQVVPDALFFNAAGARSYASRTRAYVTTIGGHAFYK